MPLSPAISSYIDLHRAVHEDNSALHHFARDRTGDERSTMHLTAFVYQFFIYNSLYQIDWPVSLSTGSLTYHPSGAKEPPKQASFEDFLKPPLVTSAMLRIAFTPMLGLSINGSWTTVVPDRLITKRQGIRFFTVLRDFQSAVRTLEQAPTRLEQALSDIPTLRDFVYKVRCNIFHGRKSLAEAIDSDQNTRIRVYYQFLNGLVTLFFSAVKAAS